MIYDLIYHAKRGPVKVSKDYLFECFDVDNWRSLILAMLKIRMVIITDDRKYWTVEIL